jgi:hypothetical protein
MKTTLILLLVMALAAFQVRPERRKHYMLTYIANIEGNGRTTSTVYYSTWQLRETELKNWITDNRTSPRLTSEPFIIGLYLFEDSLAMVKYRQQ